MPLPDISIIAVFRILAVPDLFAIGNYAESILWAVVALICFAYGFRRSGVVRIRCWQAAPIFLIFGGSDVVEVHTGAWWTP